MKFRYIAAMCVGLWLGRAAPAAAQGLLEDSDALINGYSQEFGVVNYAGDNEFTVAGVDVQPTAQGVYWHDRNGLVTRTTVGLLIAVGTALAASGPKSVESRTTYTSTHVITETRTTYYSEAEKAQIRQSGSDAAAGLFSSHNADFDLQVFGRSKYGGDVVGFKFNMLLGTGGKNWAAETGFGAGFTGADVKVAGVDSVAGSQYLGMPFRLQLGLKKVRAYAQVDWNWMAYGDAPPAMNDDGKPQLITRGHPAKLGGQVALLGRLALSAGASWRNVKKPGELGYFASVGLRF